jgi:NAD(P)-dependent dehydrogenase (short-subunit alcohol dehydrogenase family)
MPVAIVTGSDSGIGRATAARLAADGFDLGVTWHYDERGAHETAEEIRVQGRHAEVRKLDLADLPAAADVIDELAEALGGVDVLVNNAGKGGGAPILELSYESWRHTMAVDLDGAFLCAQRAARRMVEQGRGGRVVNVTSVHEHTPIRNNAAYTAAKHGLGGLTKQLALELGRYEITANSVAPGMVATPMTGLEDENPSDHPKPEYPIPRPGDAREIASCIAWLCSPDAGWTTGASFVVDGGFMLVNPSARPERM